MADAAFVRDDRADGEHELVIQITDLNEQPATLRARFEVEALTGGVSSDIVRIRFADGRSLCAKRALPQLKVASDWRAPVERNHYEVAWLRRAAAIVRSNYIKAIEYREKIERAGDDLEDGVPDALGAEDA